MVALVACGGGTRAPAHPTATSTATPMATPRATRGSGARLAGGELHAEAPARSDEQCDQLIAHALALGAAERPLDQKPTDAERVAIESELRAAWSPRCKQLTSRGYDCAMAAHTLAELDACGG